MPIRTRRALFIALLVLAAVPLGYLALANAFLSLGGIRLLTRGTNSVKVEYGSAWTVWPGVVHARNLVVTIQDHNVQSMLQFERAVVSIHLAELPRKVFHAKRVRGDGFSFRFRHRVMPESAKLPAVRALPPIPGFEDPPVFEAGAPEPPIPEDKYDLWTVELDDVDVAARDVWIEQFRYLGAGRVVGAFRLRPARQLWVGPASLDLEPGRLAADGRDAVTGFSGRIECTVRPFDVRVPRGLEVMRFISSDMNLHGDLTSGTAAEVFMPEGSVVEPLRARLEATVKLHDGILAPSTRVRVSGAHLKIRTEGVWAEFDDPWEIVATGDEVGPGGQVAAFISTGSLRAEECGVFTVGASRFSFSAASTSRDTAAAWDLGGLRAFGTLSAHAENARATGASSRSSESKRWVIDVPAARVSAELEGERLRGPISVVVDRALAEIGRATMKFDLGVSLRSRRADGDHGEVVDGTVDVRNASFSSGDRRVDGWWGNVRLDRMQLHVRPNFGVDGRISARFRDGLPGLLALREKDEIPGWLPRILPLNGLSGLVDVHENCHATDIDFPRLEAGPLVGSGRIHRAAAGETTGAVLVRLAGMVSAGIDLGPDGGISPFAGEDWLSSRRAQMDADTSRVKSAACRPRPTCGR
jgi:hypothetical protein